MKDTLHEAPTVLGTAAVILRPLRFLFDVETEIAVLVPIDPRPPRDNPDRQSDELLGQVHVHIMLSTRPPLIERQQLSGFLRAERPSRATNELDNNNTAIDLGIRATPYCGAENAILGTDMEELSGLKGRFIWLLVRMQVQQKMLHQRLWNACVQYQVTPATESYLLPIEHTNVVKVLVTDELLVQVDTKTLQFNFLSPMPQSPLPAAISPRDRVHEVPDEKISKSRQDDAKHLEELERARTLVEANETKASAALTSAQAAAAALEREREQIRVQELERKHEKSTLEQQFGHERTLLQQELERRDEQNDQLAQRTAQLEDQLQGRQDFMAGLQQAASKTDQAIEARAHIYPFFYLVLLKQRIAGDSKEREELQRRLRVLEDEKLELLKKSRACALQ